MLYPVRNFEFLSYFLRSLFVKYAEGPQDMRYGLCSVKAKTLQKRPLFRDWKKIF